MHAAIDIGTNTVRLLLYDEATGTRQKSLITTRIGEGVASAGVLCCAGMQRTKRAVTQLAEKARKHGACVVYCYATSAVREAQNGVAFMQTLDDIPGLQWEILSGEREAYYGYMGAAKGCEGVIMDIGGGSTELIAGDIQGIKGSCSVRMGCVSALEQYLTQDPPTKEQVRAFMAFAKERAHELCAKALKESRPQELIGIGGTATQLAMLKLHAKEYFPGMVDGTTLTQAELEEWQERLAGATTRERMAFEGMENDRADVILPGCMIALAVLRESGASILRVCDDDGLDGYLLYEINDAS